MKCPDKQTIESLVNKTLPGATAARLETHLAECAKCREYKVSIEEIGGLLKSAGLLLPDESYWKTLPERIKSRERLSGKTNETLRLYVFKPRIASTVWLATVAAALLIVVFSMTLLQSFRSLKTGYSIVNSEPLIAEQMKPGVYGNRNEYSQLPEGLMTENSRKVKSLFNSIF